MLSYPSPHAAKMNGVKLESPLGRAPNSAGSSTIFASPPLNSQHYFYQNAGAAVGNGGESFRRSDRYGADDDDDDDDEHALYSPDSIKVMARRGSHHRTQSNGNSSVVSSGLGIRSASDRDGSTASPTTDGQPQKKKQKRNKPTLSCFECVERKTKAGLTFHQFRCHTSGTPGQCRVQPMQMSWHISCRPPLRLKREALATDCTRQMILCLRR
jgi:hypothetical protein